MLALVSVASGSTPLMYVPFSDAQQNGEVTITWGTCLRKGGGGGGGGVPTKRVSNQSPQLHRLAGKLKFHL